SAADLLVGRVGGGAPGVADGGYPDPRRLPEHPLGAPKAAEPEDGFFEALGVGPGESMAVDEVPLRHRHHNCPAGQTLCGPGNDQLVTRKRPHFVPLSAIRWCNPTLPHVGRQPARANRARPTSAKIAACGSLGSRYSCVPKIRMSDR